MLQRRSVHLRASQGVSLQREGQQDGEDSPAARPRRRQNKQALQRPHAGQFVPAEEDHDVEPLEETFISVREMVMKRKTD